MNTLSDDIIIEASRGNAEAFEKIYNAASGFVYTVAFRVTNSREDAEEATQDVFLKVYKNLKYFGFRSSFKTWVYRITVNSAINIRNKRVKEMSKREDNYDIAIETEGAPSGREDSIYKEDNEKLVTSLLGMLNLEQRTCMILREIEGLSYKEISEALKVNINTVRTRLKRAREAILAYKGKEVVKNEL